MKKQLGELLVEREWLTREQLHQALKHQQVFGGRLGTCLLELALLNEDRLGKALAEQFGAPLASADDLRVIAEDVLGLIPAKLACRAKVVPFERYGNSVSVAMLETGDLMLQDELGFVVSKRLRVHVASEIRILEALEKHYHCGVEQRYARIWDRLNRSRFLWQDEGTSGAVGPARRPPPEAAAAPTGPASPPSWQPRPPPPLESGVSRLSAAGVAATAATRPSAVATAEVMAPPPLPPPPPPPPRVAPPEPPEPPEPPVPTPLRGATRPVAAMPPRAEAAPPPPPPAPRLRPAAPPAAPATPAAAPAAPPAAPSAVSAATPAVPAPAARQTVRDDEATSPLALPLPTGTVEELRRRLEDVDERDDVAHAALSFLERRVPRRLLFMVRGNEVAAWMGSGEGVDQRALSELSFGFDEPSLFLNLREGSPFYRGPLPRLDAHQRLVKVWGGKVPRECLLLPVRVQKRLVAVVYCDRGAEGLSGVDMEQLQEMAAALGHALESFLRKKKRAK